MAKKAPTKAEREHMGRVADLGCIICGGPAEVHHITGAGMAKRSSHYETIPLCHMHHRNGGYGVAVHAGVREWENIHGSQRDLLEKVQFLLKEQEGSYV